MRIRHLALLVLLPTAACSRFGGGGDDSDPAPVNTARATVRNASGGSVGQVTLQQTNAGVLVTGDFSGLPAGTHGIHLHAVGRCEPDFSAAGPHLNPENKQHGFRNAAGAHAGDLPNIHVPSSGVIRVELLATDASLTGHNRILDDDGASIVIHELADDYSTDPAGASGNRIACGAIQR